MTDDDQFRTMTDDELAAWHIRCLSDHLRCLASIIEDSTDEGESAHQKVLRRFTPIKPGKQRWG